MKHYSMVWLSGCLITAGELLLTGCATPEEAANEDLATKKVLMIGNSFSICALHHLPRVAAEGDLELDLASLYIGGCTLQEHWANATNAADRTYRPYRYDRIIRGKRVVDGAKRNIPDVVAGTKWDIITVQQGSRESWKSESYHPYGDNLIAKIRELAPQAKILVQETWSYTPWDDRLKEWKIDQTEMYAKLHDAYGAFARQHGLAVIPFGTAVQEWRRRLPVKYTDHSFGGDVVGGGHQNEIDHFKRDAANKWGPNSDVFHLNRKGEYFQALVWAAALGVDVSKTEYRPEYVTDAEAKLMKTIAREIR